MKKECIIWGTGKSGEYAFNKLKNIYEIIAFVDNNEKKWGEEFLKTKVISPNKIMELIPCEIIIASVYYKEIVKQLNDLGIKDITYMESSSKLFLKYNYNKLCDYEQNSKKVIKRILFVQEVTCIRTYKISNMLKKEGISVDLAYLWSDYKPSDNMNMPWDRIIPINNIAEFIDYVNKEDYDLVHHSNEPDILANLLLHTNKKIIHDTHDLMSVRGDINLEQIVSEFIANKYSAGNIYTTNDIKDYAINKFEIPNKKVFVLENLISEDFKPQKYLGKLSSIDGEIHCVYEGGLNNDPIHHRYYKEMFLRLAENRIHVHFYTASTDIVIYKEIAENNNYIHYEGKKNVDELIEEMTKYDIGLVVFNITERNYKFLQTASPNKMYDYLLAGLPIAIAKLPSLEEFIEKYPVGKSIDWNKNLLEQIKEITKISVDKEFLIKNKLTMESNVKSLIKYYESVVF